MKRRDGDGFRCGTVMVLGVGRNFTFSNLAVLYIFPAQFASMKSMNRNKM